MRLVAGRSSGLRQYPPSLRQPPLRKKVGKNCGARRPISTKGGPTSTSPSPPSTVAHTRSLTPGDETARVLANHEQRAA